MKKQRRGRPEKYRFQDFGIGDEHHYVVKDYNDYRRVRDAMTRAMEGYGINLVGLSRTAQDPNTGANVHYCVVKRLPGIWRSMEHLIAMEADRAKRRAEGLLEDEDAEALL